MNDPYSVLGVSPTATDEEVKAAYRALTKKYHPDKFTDSVSEELATEKMSEINAAYDKIMDMRRGGGTAQSASSTNAYHGNSRYSYSNTAYADVRSQIQSGNYTVADQMLEANKNEASGEWNFLKGTVCLSRGWMNEAYNYYSRAVQIEPSNAEYAAAFNQINNNRNGFMNGNNYQYNNTNRNNCGCGICEICECLMCLDCLCN